MATAIINSQMDAISESFSNISSDLTTIRPLLKNAAIGAYPTDSASGSIASFTDGAEDVPVKSLSVAIEPIQSGTGDPSPTNIRPISGHTEVNLTRAGKNLLATASLTSNVYISNTNGTEIPYSGWSASDYIPIDHNVSYRLMGLANGAYAEVGAGSCYWASYDQNKTFVRGGIGTIQNLAGTAVYVRISFSSPLKKPVFVKTADAQYFVKESDYVNANFSSIPLEQTVYGGTLNVTTGELVVTHRYIEVTSAFKIGKEGANWNPNANVFFIFIRPNTGYFGGEGAVSPIVCNICAPTSRNGISSTATNWLISFTATGTYIEWTAPFTTIDEMKAFLDETPMAIAYELATPITYQLTETQVRTFLGDNNIWADDLNVEVVYCADLAKYIDKIIAQALNA